MLNQIVEDRIFKYVDTTVIDQDLIPALIAGNISIYPLEVDISYSSILCGLKPTDLLEPNTDIYLKELFYIGGLKGYLKHLT